MSCPMLVIRDRSLRLNRQEVTVGSHPSCDLRIRSPKVSRLHVVLHVKADEVFLWFVGCLGQCHIIGRDGIKELAVTTGPVLLDKGDIVSLGGISFRIIYPNIQPARSTAAPHEKPVEQLKHVENLDQEIKIDTRQTISSVIPEPEIRCGHRVSRKNPRLQTTRTGVSKHRSKRWMTELNVTSETFRKLFVPTTSRRDRKLITNK
eukprot:TRINITY_DN2845_c0_g1_i1.p1 TRINITY_DN2845_c0_g1~~TRINITY_DN2845_c0_g1_i1.p1  ORF type:complete len:205 (+),score=12.70 TRINITY_DN2845_c0_g1_i1:105-719(+)